MGKWKVRRHAYGHLAKCPKHHVWFCWKHEEVENPYTYGGTYSPVKICPVCLKLARLTVRSLVDAYQNKQQDS